MTVGIGLVRGLAAAALAAGVLETAVAFAGNASADLGCYSAECVPNVARGVAEGAACDPLPRRAFAYGLEPDGSTVVCNPAGVWTAAGPLIGVYNVATPCPTLDVSAQGSDGMALRCSDMGSGQLRWAHRVEIPG